MKAKYYSFLILCLTLSGMTVNAQQSTKITLNLAGLRDSVIFMASYAGDKQFVVDTAFMERNGGYVFQPRKSPEPGMYIIVDASKKRLFDFIIGKQTSFTFTGNVAQLPGSLVVKNSTENQLLFDYMRFLGEKQQQQAALKQKLKTQTPGSDSALKTNVQIDTLNSQVQQHIKSLISANQGTFFADFLKAMQEPEVPVIIGNTRADTLARFQAYKHHFWDNIDLSDDRLIRTPIIHPKVEQYLTRLTSPIPDSIIIAVDTLLCKTGNSYEAFKYLMWYLTIKYESSEIMGYDAIFVHLADTWYGDPRMDWMNVQVKENLIKRANTLRPLLIGKPAPEMILFDTLMQAQSLHNINAKYTLIYFWDPDCGHCKKETPLLRDLYTTKKADYDFEVYAVCMDTSWKDMKTYIRKNETIWVNVNGFYSMTPDFRELYDVHSSPVMLLLDENKNIIAKRILTAQMADMLEMLSKKEKQAAADGQSPLNPESDMKTQE